ncbi:hypothetical protein WJX73_005269 [Symbiochloris irregularis]|uniref:Rab-GAP TBC domain-containing protein n=1 Tax=Symbiochloris irregularis TaxID=706552 RepID=A0AAW1PJC6_9CHLO
MSHSAAQENGQGSSEDLFQDAYGFRLNICTAQQLEARQRCDQAAEQVAPKWDKVKGRVLGSPDVVKDAKLKKYCRLGIPVQHRPWAWPALSGADARKRKQMAGYFDAMVHRGEVDSEVAHQIELDLPRTYPSNRWVASEEGMDALRRVLVAYSVHQPSVGYCQGMNYLAAILLLAMKQDEEDAFWLLASLIDPGGILYQGMYAQNLVGAQVEMRSFEELVAAKLPKLAAHLRELNCDMTLIATDWFLCLFATVLPSETVARVWDALLYEGPKVLYRIALALLKGCEAQLLAISNTGDLIGEIKDATKGAYDRDALMKVAFDKVGSMPMARIRGFREENQEAVDSEVAKREARAQRSSSLSTASRASGTPPASPGPGHSPGFGTPRASSNGQGGGGSGFRTWASRFKLHKGSRGKDA